MSWKRYFTPVNTQGSSSPVGSTDMGANPTRTNYSSYLPDVYSGHPNRLERYQQYDTMDSDSEVNAALDILAEFCTQINDSNKTPFELFFKEEATQTEVKVLRKYLQQWTKLNKFTNRIFKIVRNAFKYGDSFFIRDPETQQWLYIDPSKVDKIIVNESDGKVPEQYIIRDLNINLQTLTVTAINPSNIDGTPGGTNYMTAGAQQRGMVGSVPAGGGGGRFSINQNQYAIDAKHVIHLSMSEGLDNNFPFGNSLLESIFKVYKQKELLEDSILIYRVQRAPERRVFYIDVGNMPSHLAMGFVERVKNEVNQRRIPSLTGGGTSVIDASYNPLAVGDDYFFPQTAEGRGSKVEILQGGCFSMDTLVPLLDGRTLSLTELAAEYNAGKENWTYSTCPSTGRIIPGMISWAGVTQKSAKVMKLKLDNGEEIICTPEHKFPIINKGLVEARDLILGESFIPYNVRNQPISSTEKREYTQVYQNDIKEWQFVHRMVAKELAPYGIIKNYVFDENYDVDKKTVVHHVDHNRFNNSPENLVNMGFIDHSKYHAFHGFSKEDQISGIIAAKNKLLYIKNYHPEEYLALCSTRSEVTKQMWNSMSPDQRKLHVDKMVSGIENYFNNRTIEQSERDYSIRISNLINANVRLQELLQDDEFHEKFSLKIKNGWNKFKDSPEFNIRGKKISDHNKSRHATIGYTARIFEKQRINFNKEILDTVQSLCKGKTTHQYTMHDLANDMNKDIHMKELFISLNSDGKKPNFNPDDGYKPHHFPMLVKQYGYSGWKQFRKECEFYNHKLVSIEYLDEPIEVGTLTIDQDEIVHNYHNFALSVGIFAQNSNLGEIDDLRYFTNKLFRALRIPSSYLPTGPDDGGSSFNDGRVGTAYIQELRFNKYCERLQGLLNEVFNNEFKVFLYNNGVNVDPGLFDVKFNPPQNFAAYRQAEMDGARVTTFAAMVDIPFISKRFALKRFLGMNDEEVAENQKLWMEENLDMKNGASANEELRSAGITSTGAAGDIDDINSAGVPPEGMADEGTGQPGLSPGNSSPAGASPAGGQT